MSLAAWALVYLAVLPPPVQGEVLHGYGADRGSYSDRIVYRYDAPNGVYKPGLMRSDIANGPILDAAYNGWNNLVAIDATFSPEKFGIGYLFVRDMRSNSMAPGISWINCRAKRERSITDVVRESDLIIEKISTTIVEGFNEDVCIQRRGPTGIFCSDIKNQVTAVCIPRDGLGELQADRYPRPLICDERLAVERISFDGGFGGANCSRGAFLGLSDGRPSCIQRPLQEPDCPRAQTQGRHAGEGHHPLRDAITPKQAVIRAGLAIAGTCAIMFFCGWVSWREGRFPRLRFYGGLFGGLLLSGSFFYLMFFRHLLVP